MPPKNPKIRLNGSRKDELAHTTLASVNFQIPVEPIQRTCVHKTRRNVVRPLLLLITLLLSVCPLKRVDDTLANLGFAKRAQGIDLQPFIYTVLVEKVCTWQLSQFIVVSVFRQADATDLHIIFKTISF